MRKRFVEWLKKVRPTKKGIIERLIRRWLPKYKLVKIRGPYKKKRPSPCSCNECVEAYGLTSQVPEFTTDGGKNEEGG